MKRLLLALALTLACVNSQAQVLDCFDCVLGIWDDVQLTSNRGSIEPNIPKDIYLGFKFAGGFDALQGLEFSIAGMRFEEDGISLLSVTELVPVAIRLGMFQAPADTSRTSTQSGGMNLAWSLPLYGNQTLFKLQILILSPITNKVLQVKRHYPASNDEWQTAIFNLPDAPFYTPVRTGVGCYVLNWTGDPLPCDVITSIEQSTWSAMKQLYR